MPGRPWLATAQSGTGTVRTPQPGRPYPQKITIRPVNLARPHRRPVRRTVAAAAEVRLWRSSDCRSRRRISTTFAGVRGIPATVVGPEVDTRSVLRVRTVVVFPVPFGSMKPKTSSRPISKERSSNAARSPKRLPSPWAGNACPDYEQTAPGRRSARRMPPPSPGGHETLTAQVTGTGGPCRAGSGWRAAAVCAAVDHGAGGQLKTAGRDLRRMLQEGRDRGSYQAGQQL